MEDSVLAPKLKWIGSRCYRVNATNSAQYADSANSEIADGETIEDLTPGPYIETGKIITIEITIVSGFIYFSISTDLYEEGDGEEDSYDIKLLESGHFKSTFHVPK